MRLLVCKIKNVGILIWSYFTGNLLKCICIHTNIQGSQKVFPCAVAEICPNFDKRRNACSISSKGDLSWLTNFDRGVGERLEGAILKFQVGRWSCDTSLEKSLTSTKIVLTCLWLLREIQSSLQTKFTTTLPPLPRKCVIILENFQTYI